MVEKNKNAPDGTKKKFDIKNFTTDIGKAATTAADSV